MAWRLKLCESPEFYYDSAYNDMVNCSVMTLNGFARC